MVGVAGEASGGAFLPGGVFLLAAEVGLLAVV
jgi:hypothetical protein